MTSETFAPRTFKLDGGGPFLFLIRRFHLVKPNGKIRSVRLALFAWLPIVIAAGVRLASHRPVDPALYDISQHTRILVALPAMLLAQRLLGRAVNSALRSLYLGDICEDAKLNRIVERGERLRDLWWPELVLAGLAVFGGQLVLWRVTGPTGVFSGETEAMKLSFSRVWYCTVALPLVQFVMFRWLWRWGIWGFVLAQICLLPLVILATHPDRAAGLGCLARPMSSFAVMAFALGSILAGAKGTQLLQGRTTVQQLMPSLLAFLVVVLLLAAGPLLPFCVHLYRARRRTLSQYGDFANEYVRGFHAKWLATHRSGEEALGTADLQSLNDLGGAFSVITTTRLFAFSMRSVIELSLCAALPFLPLFASLWTMQELVERLFRTLLGGLPL